MLRDYISNYIALLNAAILTKRLICKVPYSKLGEDLSSLLFKSGYIVLYRVININNKSYIYILMKNLSSGDKMNPFLSINLISKPSNKVYWDINKLVNQKSKSGILTEYILSTSKGLLFSSSAIENNIGGLVLIKIN